MTAVLKQEPPDLPVAERHIPPALARIVDHCLQKSPAARFQSAGDLAFALEALSVQSSAADAAIAGAVPRSHSPRLAWSLAVASAIGFATAASVAALLYFRPAGLDAQLIRFSVLPPEGWRLAITTTETGSPVSALPVAMSPDGRRLAFVARNSKGAMQLWLRPLDALVARPLPGTEGATSPFWSPDSRFIAFFANRKLKKVEASGGPAFTVCDAGGGAGGTWSPDGTIVFAAAQRPLHKVSAAGGVPSVAVPFASGETGHMRPLFLPDGRHVLYRAQPGGPDAGRPTVVAAALESGARTRLVESDSTNVAYSQGHLLFLRGTTLMALPFDTTRLSAIGEPVPLVESVQTIGSPYSGVFSASPGGVLAYHTGSVSVGSQLAWVDRSGKVLSTIGERAAYSDVELSPDGRRALVSIFDPIHSARDVWVVDLIRGLRSRLTFDSREDFAAIWSPDGSRILFGSDRRIPYLADMYLKASTGTGSEDVVFAGDSAELPTSWSPDGRFVLHDARGDIALLPMSGDRKPTMFLRTPFNETFAQFSPDGRWVAYVSNESGRPEVYVVPFQGVLASG